METSNNFVNFKIVGLPNLTSACHLIIVIRYCFVPDDYQLNHKQ